MLPQVKVAMVVSQFIARSLFHLVALMAEVVVEAEM
jgi:hypothetical protein